MITLHRQFVFLCTSLALIAPDRARATEALPAEVTQLIVSVAPDWDATRGKLQWLERTADGWRPVSPIVPVLYGRAGLAWGRGVLGANETGRKKIEGDGRAPAGVFSLGTIYGEEARLPDGADFPYHRVTAADAWIEDPQLPDYNRHVVIDPKNPPPWFEKERMKLNDPAFRWRVEIRHNSDPPVPGAGSAIFFHVRRGADRKTAGCTTMAEESLVAMIRWLRKSAKPHYVLLPWSEYQRLAEDWKLPGPEIVTALAPP